MTARRRILLRTSPDPPRAGRPRLPLAFLALAAGCGGGGADHGGEGALAFEMRRRESAKVRVAPVIEREMVRILSTTTNVESEAQIEVFPRTSGVVHEVQVEEGDVVGEGQVLAVVDQREARAALADAQVALREAEEAKPRLELAVAEALERAESARLSWEQSVREAERNEKTGLLSTIDLDKLRLARDTNARDWEAAKIAHERAKQEAEHQDTAIERAQLAVARAQLELSFTEIVAPFAGVIAERTIKVGDTVSTSARAFTLTDADNLRAVVYRPQRELAFFQGAHTSTDESTSGDVEIRVFPEAYEGEEYRGEIRFLSPTIDVDSGSFRVTVALEQPPAGSGRPRLAPGMLVRLEIVTERHPDALVVPKRALRREADTRFLFAVRDGKAERVVVREGFSDEELVEVLPVPAGALTVGEPVVVVGNRDLEDAEAVETEAWSTDLPAEATAAEAAAAETAGEDGGAGSVEGGGGAADGGGAGAAASGAD